MDLCNRNDIQALLQRHGFYFSKAMGQNFLIQGWVPRDIAAACGADEHTGVLEIGPGIGPLTRELAQRAGKVVSVELDRRLYPVLEETMADFPNFTLIRGDVMQQELPALVREHLGGLRPILCANLPYNVTTPLITAFLEAGCFESVTEMIQKEVAQRLCADARGRDLLPERGKLGAAGRALSEMPVHIFRCFLAQHVLCVKRQKILHDAAILVHFSPPIHRGSCVWRGDRSRMPSFPSCRRASRCRESSSRRTRARERPPCTAL